MKYSNTELIFERYCRLKKWMVEKDIPILLPSGKKFWSDLDILAVGEEVHLINCKDFMPGNKDISQVIENLKDSEKYIKRAKIPFFVTFIRYFEYFCIFVYYRYFVPQGTVPEGQNIGSNKM